ncbi:MAG: hypothetical protein IT378_23710 [Sandaracinaceae bacterium]|nr:hypothetical protein [Sandaracinaceae bacterium]
MQRTTSHEPTPALFDALENLEEEDLPRRPPWWTIGGKIHVVDSAAARVIAELADLRLPLVPGARLA